MNRSKKILGVSAFFLGLFLTVVAIVFAAPVPRTLCRPFWQNGIMVAQHCYTMTAEWKLSEQKVRCIGDGSATYQIFEPGYTWSDKYKACNPKTYSTSATGNSSAKLKKNGNLWKTSRIRCNAYGNVPAYIQCYYP